LITDTDHIQIIYLNQKAFLLDISGGSWEVFPKKHIGFPVFTFFGDLNCSTFYLIYIFDKTVWPWFGLFFQLRFDWFGWELELLLKLLLVLTGVLLGLYLLN